MPSFKLHQLLAAESNHLSPAPTTIWFNTDKLLGVALIEGKCKEDPDFVFDVTKVDNCANYCAKANSKAKMKNGVNSVGDGVLLVENGVKDAGDKKVDPRCPNSSNPFHVCAYSCFERMNEGRKSGNGKLMAERKGVERNCVNASNPYHICAEYCLERTRELDSPRGRKSVPFSPKDEGQLSLVERKDVDPKCVNASNPFHKCAEYCLVKKQEMDSQHGKQLVSSSPKNNGKLHMVERNDVNPSCVNASNPYHKCTQYCIKRMQEIDNKQGRKSVSSSPKRNEKFNMVERKDVNANCVNASNPYHKSSEYCLERKQEMDGQQGRKSESSSPKSIGNLAVAKRKDADPNCVNASNPYHKCAEYCLERKQDTDCQQGRKSASFSPKGKRNSATVEKREVNPNCINASNPFHKCAKYCLERKHEMDSHWQRQSVSSSTTSKELLVVVEIKDVNPNCVNASNPYHKCTEYCLVRGQKTDSS